MKSSAMKFRITPPLYKCIVVLCVAIATLALVACSGIAEEGAEKKVRISLPPIESGARSISDDRIPDLKGDVRRYRVTVNGTTREGTGSSYEFMLPVGVRASVTVECLNSNGDVIIRAEKAFVVSSGENNFSINLKNDGTEIIPSAPQPVPNQVTYSYGEANKDGNKSGLPSDPTTYSEGDLFTVEDGSGMTWDHATQQSGFTGWSASPAIEPENVGQATNAPISGQKYKMPKGGVTLTAQWNKKSYTITYDMNAAGSGGTQTSTSINQGSVQALEDYTINSTTPASVSDGVKKYTFMEWSDGNGNTYAVGRKITNVTGNITLTAQWSDKNVWTVTYEKGSTQADTQDITNWIDSDNAEDGNSVTLPTLQATGYTFNGWQITGESGNKTGSYTPTQNVTATAQWTANTYKVKFSAGSGTGSIADMTFTYDAPQSLTAVGNSMSKTGYTFSGWSGSNGQTYNDSESVSNLTATNNGEVTLTAQWSPVSYDIRLHNDNGGVAGTFASGQATATVQATYDSAATLTAITPPSGYTFAGWANADNMAVPDSSITQSGGSYTATNLASSQDYTVDLYPVWQIINYKIVYNGNSNTGGTAPAEATYTVTNQNVQLADAGSLARTNYNFLGWNTTQGATSALTLTFAQLQQQATGSDANNKTLTLYAVWETAYTLTLNLNGGSWTTASDNKTQYSASDLPLTLPSPNPPSTLSGYVFAGWIDGGNNYGLLEQSRIPSGTTGTKTYYAVYKTSTQSGAAATTNTGGINFVAVQGGTVPLAADYMPVVSNFSMSKTEITQAQWQAVMGSLPSSMATADGATDVNPVNMVSWYDAIAFCNKLSLKEGKTPCYSVSSVSDWNALTYDQIPTRSNTDWDNATCDFDQDGYRLPTEAEWEYAARGGSYYSSFTYSGSATVENVAWYTTNSDSKTHPVGDSSKTPNALGISDMSGNVWEWCWDRYSGYASANGSTTSDPRGATTGSDRVRRGGSWYNGASYGTVAGRNYDNPFNRSSNYGLRLVCRP